jgi:hypothetical protein
MRSFLNKYVTVLPLVILLFGVTACDSSDDSQTDADRFIGTWVVDETMDDSGSVDLPAFSETRFNFADTGTATITAVGIDPNPTVQLSGSYAVSEATNTVTLSITITGLGTVPLSATYSFSGDDDVTLTIGSSTAALLGPLFGTQFSGSVILTLVKQ